MQCTAVLRLQWSPRKMALTSVIVVARRFLWAPLRCFNISHDRKERDSGALSSTGRPPVEASRGYWKRETSQRTAWVIACVTFWALKSRLYSWCLLWSLQTTSASLRPLQSHVWCCLSIIQKRFCVIFGRFRYIYLPIQTRENGTVETVDFTSRTGPKEVEDSVICR